MRRFHGSLFTITLLAFASIGSLATVQAAQSTSFYVATDGNDANPGTKAKPFATFEKARDAARQSKTQNPTSKIDVFVRAGTYELAKTFTLSAEDSGTEKAPVVYQAYPNEKVLLIGGKRITGFAPHRGAILKADVGAQGFTNYFRQLFLDGKRMQLARYPNHDAVNPNGGFAYVDGQIPKDSDKGKEKPEYPARQIHYKLSDARTWAHPELAEVIYFPWHNWLNISVPVASVDKDKRLITLTRDAKTHAGYPGGIRPGDRYFVRNLFEELDSAGEWFLDRQTRTLYFWPPKPLAGLEVYAPTTDDMIEISAKTEWIIIRGFTMECGDGYAVALRGANNCIVACNTIRNTGGGQLGKGGGVLLENGANCGVVGNDIYDVGNVGIMMRGGNYLTLTAGGHYADNNYLHHIGVLNAHGLGIHMDGIGLRVSHNLIHDITRSGLFGGGNDCIVEYNHIRHDNLMTEDTAGYYNGGNWHNRGQIVRYNYVHDTLGYGRRGGKWVSPLFAWGIYFDDDVSGTHAYGNIVARVPLGGFHVHAGRDNIIENNIIIDCAEQQFQMSGHDPAHSQWLIDRKKAEFAKFQRNPAYAKYPEVPALDIEKAWLMVGNKFRHNIVCYQDTNSVLYTYFQDRCPEQNETDRNLVWHHDQPITVQHSTGWKLAKLSWEEWQKAGHDQHSIIADPLFVNAAKDDYRLKTNSPAFKLGFKPIPVEKIGPYEDPLRASWPIVEAEGVREHPQPIEMGPLWPDRAPIGDGTFETTNATVTVYLPTPAKANGAAIVICPGGGYMRHVTSREGHPIARWLTEHGIAGIILEYRLPQGRSYVSLLDAQRTIRTVRANAALWNINPKRVGIMGFSAGGHLASTAGTHFDGGDPKSADPVNRLSCRPDFMVLIYPVVTMGDKTHSLTKTNLLGSNPKPEMVELFSNEKQVTDKTPPSFLAHAIDDKPVPPENSRQFVEAMKTHNVPVSYLELPSGGHGLNGCQGPLWEEWKAKSLEWMAAQGIISGGKTPRAPKTR